MAKISDLPLVDAPDGSETGVILKDGIAKRARFDNVIAAASIPILAAMQLVRDQAAQQAVLAAHYANDEGNDDVPGGAPGERGARYWATKAAQTLASFLLSTAGLRAVAAATRNFVGAGPRIPLLTINRREVISFHATSGEAFWMGGTWPVPSSGPMRKAVSAVREYSGDPRVTPLLTVNRRQTLGFNALTGEPLWMGTAWPIPSSGPLRKALPIVRDYSGNGAIPVITINRRRVIDMDPVSFAPLWLGQPWPGATNTATVRALPRDNCPKALSTTHVRGIFAYGQSLGVGDEARGVISAAQPYANLMLNGGLKTGDAVSGMSSLVPMIEQMQAAGGAVSTVSGETIVSSACNYAVRLAIAAGLAMAPTSMVMAGGAPGLGSQSIAQLSKGTVPYARFLNQVAAQNALVVASGRTYSVDLVAWVQGEQNAELGTTRAAYLAALLQLQADLDADIKAITGQTNTVRILLYQTSHKIVPSGGAVALAQMDAIKQSPYFHFVTPCWPFPRYDFVHLVAAGYNWMGKYFGRAIAQIVAQQREPDCMRPLSATVINGGTTLTVQFQVPAAPIAIDTVNLANVANYGMKVVDDTGTLTLTNIAVAGTALTMTLDRPLGANARWRLGLDTPGTDNGRATHAVRDSTTETVSIAGTTYPLWHISAADELPIINLEA
jgi:hypothetical protein